MRIRSFRASRVAVAVAAAGLVGLAAAGCTGGTPSAEPQTSQPAAHPTTTTVAAPPAVPSTKDTTGNTASAQAATVQALKFPNTSATVMFAGYDAKNHLPKFQKVVQNPKSPFADLIPDPADPAVHELPVAPDAPVTSIDPNGFPFETCPPVNCTSGDIVQNVMSHTTLWAHIHVNAADQIDAVHEIAY